MYLIYIAVMVALAVAGTCLHFLRKLTRPQVNSDDLNAWIDISWESSSPLERLLDPSEFEFLRKRGLSEARICELRTKRRSLFRMYMRRLTHEFNLAYAALQTAAVTGDADR